MNNFYGLIVSNNLLQVQLFKPIETLILLQFCTVDSEAPRKSPCLGHHKYINLYGMGPLRLVNGNLNLEKYQQEIIFDIEEICKVDPLHPRKGLIFQQDNAPAHSSRSTLNFMQA